MARPGAVRPAAGRVRDAREQLTRDIGELTADQFNETGRLSAAIDAWYVGGSQGARPTVTGRQLDEEIADLEGERGGSVSPTTGCWPNGSHTSRRTGARCSPTSASRWRPRPTEYRALVDADRGEASRAARAAGDRGVDVDLPEPDADERAVDRSALVGAKKRLQEPHLPGLQSGVVAASIFALLRADVGFCESVATVEQAPLEQGVSVSRLRRSDARWLGDGQQDLVGPTFDAAWGESRRGEGRGRTDRRISGAPASVDVGRGMTVTTVCSKCLRIRPCQCPRTDGRQRRRRQAANIESRRKTRHWARLRLQRLKLAGGLCELRHHGCTRVATTVHLIGGGDH